MHNNLKNILIFTAIILWLMPLYAQKQRVLDSKIPFIGNTMKVNMGLLKSAANYNAPITLTQVPTDFYEHNDSGASGDVVISWEEWGYRGDFIYSKFPNVLSNTDTVRITDTSIGDRRIEFNVGDESIETGVYYCQIVSHVYKDSTSIEFNLIIEHERAPVMQNQVNPSSRNLRWLKDSEDFGTPYFHVILSNRPARIENVDADPDDEVIGMNIIYQAITPNTEILYRSPDPSGFYNFTKSPYLAHAHKYYWLVFNNYGNNPAMTSDIPPEDVMSFTYHNPASRNDTIYNIAPVGITFLPEDQIDFSWNNVQGSTYHFYLYEEVEDNGNIAAYLLYDTTLAAGDTSLTFANPDDFFINTKYWWNVSARNGNLYTHSDPDSFYFHVTDSAIMSVQIRSDAEGNPTLGRVNLDIYKTDGFNIKKKFLTQESGKLEREMPAGTYRIVAYKEGYSTVDTSGISLPGGATTEFDIILQNNPTYFVGNVNFSPPGNVTPVIHFLSSSLEDTFSVYGIRKPNGEFSYRANVTPGSWTIYATAEGYQSSTVIDTVIQFNEYLELPPFVLIERDQGINITVVDTSYQQMERQFSITLTDITGNILEQQYNKISPYPMPLEPGQYRVYITMTDYFSDQAYYSVEVVEHDFTELQVVMIEGGSLSGNAYDNYDQQLTGVLIEAIPQSGDARYNQTNTDITGHYSLPLKPGDYRITAELANHQQADTILTIESNESITFNPVLHVFESHVQGIVSDTSGAPLEGARVTFYYYPDPGVGNPGFTVTNDTGYYDLNIPSNVQLRIVATLDGYGDQQSIITVPVDSTCILNFVLTRLQTFITVNVIRNGSGTPVIDATVSVLDTTVQPEQNIYTRETDMNGSCRVYANFGDYIVQVEKQNYQTVRRRITFSSDTTKVEVFILYINYGSLSGVVLEVVNDISTPFVNQPVSAVNQTTQVTVWDTTDTNGTFQFTDLEPGEIYRIYTAKLRYLTIPASGINYLVIPGVDTTGFELRLVQAQISTLEIMTEGTEFANNENINFVYQAKEGTRLVQIEPPLWEIIYGDSTIIFETAEFSETVNGYFVPDREALDADFSIRVTDLVSGLSDSKDNCIIYAPVTQQTFSSRRSISLRDYSGLILQVDSSDINPVGGNKIYLRRTFIPESKAVSKEGRSYGKAYMITGLRGIRDDLRLSLPVPDEVSTSNINKDGEDLNIGKWNNTKLDWDILANSSVNFDDNYNYYTVVNTITQDGEYIVLATSRPLGIHNLKLLPNPFSPFLANRNDPSGRLGQAIKFNLTSLDTKEPFVTIKIFNMNGELVRTLKNYEPLVKGIQYINWDGKTNSGRYARNGRYLVHIKVKDSTGEKEELKATVLIK